MKLRQLRDQRTRTLQTLFGTVKVIAPRIRLCPCADTLGMVDVSFSPLARLLPDGCTAQLRQLHAELGARHSFREADWAHLDAGAPHRVRRWQASMPCGRRTRPDSTTSAQMSSGFVT